MAGADEAGAVFEGAECLEAVGDGMDVAQRPLERMPPEERGPRRSGVQLADDVPGDLDGVEDHPVHRRPLLPGSPVTVDDGGPHVLARVAETRP